jgi:hypothetical protein
VHGRAKSQPPPLPPSARRAPSAHTEFEDDVHSAPTMIIDAERIRRGRHRS